MNYTTDNITILSFIEHVRHRIGMWIGSTDEDGIHHLLREVVDNSVDEMTAGYADTLTVSYYVGTNAVNISDNGRGIPFGIHKSTGTETMIEIFTTSFSGGKFDDKSYESSGGMNGVGLGVLNALSSVLRVESCRDKQIKQLEFSQGVLLEEQLTPNERAFPDQSSTSVYFIPDPELFPDVKFNPERIKTMLWELSNLLPKKDFKFHIIGTEVTDQGPTIETFEYRQEEYLEGMYLATAKSDIEIFKVEYRSEKINAIVWFNKETPYSTRSFMNMINTEDHGSHVDGVVRAILNSLKKLTGKTITKSQIVTGMNIIVSMTHQAPIFRGQSKSKVSDGDVETKVYTDIYPTIYQALEADTAFVKYLIEIINAQSRVVDEFEIKTSVSAIKDKVKSNRLPIKLKAVHNCSAEDRELIICEGDSAGGGVTTARNPKFQEVLPIKGKILNALKTNRALVLKSKEVSDIFVSIGGTQDTNTTLRCKKVFILTDSDPDGSHITSLLVSLFTVLYPSFIEKHELYVMNTPLYTAVHKDQRAYGKDITTAKRNFRKLHGKAVIPEIRYNKGLGEMDPAELVDVLHPATRDVTRLEIGPNSVVEMGRLMGDDMQVRREILNGQKI